MRDLSAKEVQQVIEAAAERHRGRRMLNGVLATVIVGDQEPLTVATGASTVGVPTSADMHLRNGAIAITYLAVVTLRAVEEGRIGLDDVIAPWLPDEAFADEVTFRQLIGMTAGYPDYVGGSEFSTAINDDPFKGWTYQDQLSLSGRIPRERPPGERFGYSHTNLVVLARALELACGESMESLMGRYVLGPLGLSDTRGEQTAWMPDPVLHAFTASRGRYEDSTFWNPSWTLGRGSVQYSTLPDMAKSMHRIVGAPGFLTAESYRELIDQGLGSVNVRGHDDPHYGYGLGLMQIGEWLGQTPLFGGYASAVLTLPSHVIDGGVPITIGAVATLGREALDDWGGLMPNRADELVRILGEELVEAQPPPPYPEDWRSWRERMNRLRDGVA